jgi:hypothetical protein
MYENNTVDFLGGELKYKGNVNQFIKGLQDFDENTLDPLIIRILTNIFNIKIELVI